MPRKINIAIDGQSSCGKGTLAKNIAKSLNYTFIDSGAMYRAVTLYFLRNGFLNPNFEISSKKLEGIKIEFVYNSEKEYFETILNGELVEQEIRSMEVSRFVSQISALKPVRDFLVAQQKEMGKDKGVVMDGRDIGTVVFPDAELKIFMTAKPEIRAKRRFDELLKKGLNVSYETVLQNIQDRDFIDSNRDESPLKKADDAITLDNSKMTIDEQAKVALSWANGVIKLL